MAWNAEKRCWAWSYEGAVRTMEVSAGIPPRAREAPARRLRDMLATVQHQSDKPIRPVEVITRLLSGGGNVFSGGDSKGGMRR